MFSCPEQSIGRALAAGLLALAGFAHAQTPSFNGIGRAATPAEVAAWDIDVRPDFKGLPKGQGSVSQGAVIWEAQCASCHGFFGENNEIFTPLVGGTTAADIQTGRVARLTDTGYPGRTTLMRVATVSTLWDYINRAMPWTRPKSLSADEVYAVLAYMLNLGGIVPEGFVLSQDNMTEVQQRMPNRAGMTTQHGLWPGRGMGRSGQADIKASACMSNCSVRPEVASSMPDHARNAHGNLAQQNRLVGPQRGADTTRPAGSAPVALAAPSSAQAAPTSGDTRQDIPQLLKKYACSACHASEGKIVGPGLREISKAYAARPDGIDYLARKMVSGGSGVWGTLAMPPQALSTEEARAIAQWIVEGAKP